ncbi:hypothetical protein [Pseudomonas putida]|uniref:hypothetical protein n=1 Tax=Pseudomonas putida TaxID=303 RepID=UPI003734D3E2
MQLMQDNSTTQQHQVPAGAAGSIERRKAYATHLVKTALRYADEAELRQIISAVEHQIATMLSSRFNPGLNDASYEVYRKFWLKGDEQ